MADLTLLASADFFLNMSRAIMQLEIVGSEMICGLKAYMLKPS